MPKWVVTVPNAGHDLGGGAEAVETLGAFALGVAGKASLPKESWRLQEKGKELNVSLKVKSAKLVGFKVWVAEAENLDFRPRKFISTIGIVKSDGSSASATVPLYAERNQAAFGEATYQVGTHTYRLCSPTKMIVHRAPSHKLR
jgi:hypothetical protein